MNDKVRSRLEDALIAASAIHDWVPQHSRDIVESDLLVESAYIRQFEVIGEALRVVRSVDDHIEMDFPEIHEWISLRHHLIHEYRDVDRDLLWEYASREIPILIGQLTTILGN